MKHKVISISLDNETLDMLDSFWGSEPEKLGKDRSKAVSKLIHMHNDKIPFKYTLIGEFFGIDPKKLQKADKEAEDA